MTQPTVTLPSTGVSGNTMRLPRRPCLVVVLTASLGLALLAEGPCVRQAFGQEELFVVKRPNLPALPSIAVYNRAATGNTAPFRTLTGAATGLEQPTTIFIDVVNNELVVGNNSPRSITVYPRAASGNAAPLRRLAGPATRLEDVGLSDVFVDTVNNELVVATFATATGVSRIMVYPRTASGNVAPIRTLAGPATGLSSFSVVVDAVNDELVVTNSIPSSVTVYPRTADGDIPPIRTLAGPALAAGGTVVDTINDELVIGSGTLDSVRVYARTASGDAAPIRTLVGPATGLNAPGSVIVDTVNNELMVKNNLPLDAPSVTVYARTASGNTSPIRTLVGPDTGLTFSRAMDATVGPVRGQELFVANNSSVTVYSRTASGNIAPNRTLAGPATGLANLAALVVDRTNEELVVANQDNNSVTVYSRTARSNAAPTRTLVGPTTGLSGPSVVLIDVVNNELFVANVNNNSVTVYPRTASGDAKPTRRLSGVATDLDTPLGLAVDTLNNELIVANSAGNSLTVYPRTASGDVAPSRTLLGLSAPAGVAVDTVNHELLVANTNEDSVRVYARTASGFAVPSRIITGPATAMFLPVDLAVDTVNNEVLVANSTSSVTVYARTADGNIPPIRRLAGSGTGLNAPQGVAITTKPAFDDVSAGDLFFPWIEALFDGRLTGGCSITPPLYCPDAPVTRDQMAVFLSRGIHGADYVPPPATGTVFVDVPATHVFGGWIERLARDGITGGCSLTPSLYCPDAVVTRAQMAVFLLRAEHGASYDPPGASGTTFLDVSTDSIFAEWIEQLALEGITGGCSANPPLYCPDTAVTRGEMAVFLVRTFELPL